ncbi:MAG: protein-glutamate O-methyltransferase CheR [Deltaproteobacteria bacterium]|nr:protein-glutamate O-methyltransferase CheR [Deltaproteobacteria bacterium]MBZ0220112.1 protein-glutamate O-methyltransferase CheR [Deltaproteobacteria bacterium]
MNLVHGTLHRHGQSGSSDGLSSLLEKVYEERGWDFRNYKRSTLSRRVSKLLHSARAGSCEDYLHILKKDPYEYHRLFSTLTIKVSEFFREPEVFSALEGIIRREFRDTPLKSWCCGCAYGEEAYSLGALFAEAMSPEALSGSRIFATDIDCDALDQARRAVYREDAIANVSAALREKYFVPADGFFRVSMDLRSLVRFGTLDIVQSPSIKGVSVLFCRNLFIYFNKPLQEKVFTKLDYALRPGGILVMGKAEVLPQSYSSRYEPLGRGLNIYRKCR